MGWSCPAEPSGKLPSRAAACLCQGTSAPHRGRATHLHSLPPAVTQLMARARAKGRPTHAHRSAREVESRSGSSSQCRCRGHEASDMMGLPATADAQDWATASPASFANEQVSSASAMCSSPWRVRRQVRPPTPDLPGFPLFPLVPLFPGLPDFPDLPDLPGLPGLPGCPGLPMRHRDDDFTLNVSKRLRLRHVKTVKPALINTHQPPKIQQLQARSCVSDFWALACLKFKLPPLPPPSLNQTGPLLNKNFLHMAPKSRTSACFLVFCCRTR